MKRTFAVAATVAAALALVGCGGGSRLSTNTAPQSPATVSTAPATTVAPAPATTVAPGSSAGDSADLSAVDSDVTGIDAATTQADNDTSSADSAQAQSDSP